MRRRLFGLHFSHLSTDTLNSSSMETPDLNKGHMAEDVIHEILLRLPVKTLLQFKCVCKHWYSLITSPAFINHHLIHESNQECLLVRHYKPELERYSFSLYVDEMLSRYEEPDHLQIPFMASALMGPLNGVFCAVSMSGRLALLNPATRQFKPIAPFSPNVGPHLCVYDNLLGLGLDPLSGHHKVISIQYFWNEEIDSSHYPCVVSVYTSGSDSWRHFEDASLVNSGRCAYRSLCNTYLNGVYYWIMDSETDCAILAFDMRSETFREIQVPDCIKSKEGDLTLYADSLALLTCDLDKIDKFIDVWVMGKEGCWARCLTVGPFQDIRWPIGFWKEDEILLETENSLLTLYNVCTQKLRTVESRRKENGFFIYWVFRYKDSLVSIEGERDDCKLWDVSTDFVKDFFK